MLLAESMPRSKAPDPSAPLVRPRSMRSTVVLGPSPGTSAAGVLLASDDFEPLDRPGRERAYWAKRVEAGKRIAVTTLPRGEKDKLYSLYLLDGSMSQAAFLQLSEPGPLRGRIYPLVSDGSPPLLFQLPADPVTWLLEIGPQEGHLQTWRVYARPVSRHVCTITVRFSTRVLPADIQAAGPREPRPAHHSTE